MRVFVGEDSVVERKLVQVVLQRIPSLEVTCFDNGLDLWLACLEEPPEIVIVDLLLPTLTGFEFCELFKRHQGLGENTYILAISSMSGEETREESIRAGATDFLPKPLNPENLIRHLEQTQRQLLGHRGTNSLAYR